MKKCNNADSFAIDEEVDDLPHVVHRPTHSEPVRIFVVEADAIENMISEAELVVHHNLVAILSQPVIDRRTINTISLVAAMGVIPGMQPDHRTLVGLASGIKEDITVHLADKTARLRRLNVSRCPCPISRSLFLLLLKESLMQEQVPDIL